KLFQSTSFVPVAVNVPLLPSKLLPERLAWAGVATTPLTKPNRTVAADASAPTRAKPLRFIPASPFWLPPCVGRHTLSFGQIGRHHRASDRTTSQGALDTNGQTFGAILCRSDAPDQPASAEEKVSRPARRRLCRCSRTQVSSRTNRKQ